MDMICLAAVVETVMNVFSGNFGAKVKAIYVEENRKSPLGVVETGEEYPVTILIDESYTNAWGSEMITQTSDILVYGEADSILANKKCEGGKLKIGTRNLRIETWAESKNQRTGKVEHVELKCSEQ